MEAEVQRQLLPDMGRFGKDSGCKCSIKTKWNLQYAGTNRTDAYLLLATHSTIMPFERRLTATGALRADLSQCGKKASYPKIHLFRSDLSGGTGK